MTGRAGATARAGATGRRRGPAQAVSLIAKVAAAGLLAGVCAGVCTTILSAQPAAEDTAGQTTEDRAERTANRTFYRDLRPAHWFWNGMDPLVLERILTRIKGADGPREDSAYHDGIAAYGPGNWTYEFERVGDAYMTRGRLQETLDHTHVAAAYYRKAAAAYATAKFPHFAENTDQNRAYAKNIDALEAAWTVRGLIFERVTSTFDGQPVDGILMLPALDRGPVPLVLGTNGIDVLKGEFFDMADMLIARGIGFFAFDMAGTGSHAHLRLSPEYERLTRHFMTTLGADARVDTARLGLIGVSFGGNAVVKLAMQQPAGLKAVVNMCGPVHSVFMLDAGAVAGVEAMYRDAFVDRAKLTGASDAEIADALKGFSLIEQGLLGGGRTTPVPIFSVNAAGDYVAPDSDMALVTASTQDGTLIYSGEGDHCPQDRFMVTPVIADWLKDRL